MSRVSWKAAAAAAVAFAAMTALPGFTQRRKGRPGKHLSQRIIPIQSQISVQNGKTVITMSAQAQELAGISAARVKKTSAPEVITAPAAVLLTKDLASQRESVTLAKAKLRKAQAREKSSRKKYHRLKSHDEKKHDVSRKALEAAEKRLHADEAATHAAQQELASQEKTVRQKWGEVVEKWVEDGTPDLKGVLKGRELLVRVTLSAWRSSVRPPEAELQLSDGRVRKARFVSSIESAGKYASTAGLLYRTGAHGGFRQGLKLEARLPLGQTASGVLIPGSAVVHAAGKSWVYQETTPGRFLRVQVETTHETREGFIVSQGISPGDKVVVRRAEVLLAEELRFSSQPSNQP